MRSTLRFVLLLLVVTHASGCAALLGNGDDASNDAAGGSSTGDTPGGDLCAAPVGTDSGTAGTTAPTVIACPSRPTASCASFTDTHGKPASVYLAEGTLYGVDSQTMGTFASVSNHVLAYVYVSDATAVPHLYVVDLSDAKLIAWLGVPGTYTIHNTYFSYIQDPDGNKHPFFAAGAHYLNGTAYGTPYPGTWDFMCVFDPASIASP